MNENSRYIYLIGAAIVLMSLGLWGAYKWEQGRRVTRESAIPDAIHPMFNSSNQESQSTPEKTDTIPTDNKKMVADSLMKQRKAFEGQLRSIRHEAEREGYRWQQALSQYRFREPAEECMTLLKEHGERVRDSLLGVYKSDEAKDSLMACFDREIDACHVRLLQQVFMLPTAKQALDAEQITQDEYNQIISSISKKKSK